MENSAFDVVVIGGGIAGTAVAAHLAKKHKVAVLEMEPQAGYHSTGRSAALFAQTYGNGVIRALTRASRDFLFTPPAEFTEEKLVSPRAVMIFGREESRNAFEAFVSRELPAPNLTLVDAKEAVHLCPVLKEEGLLGAVVDRGSADIEVHNLHQGYIRRLRQAEGFLFLDVKANSIRFAPSSRTWTVDTSQGAFTAPILVNAAGAWADDIARMAGVTSIGLEPRRRTAALIDAPDDVDIRSWPMILDAEEHFYMKPDAGSLLISPADETLSEPEDSQPDELDVAIAADRAETYTSIRVRRIKSKWAGLRSFVEDRSPVVGFDPSASGFFWLAALGGYGIQTAPALSELAAKLIAHDPIEQDLAALNFDLGEISPARIRRAPADGAGSNNDRIRSIEHTDQ